MSEQEKRNERNLSQAREGSYILGPEGIPMLKEEGGWKLGNRDVLEESILAMYTDDDIVVYQLVEAPKNMLLSVTFVIDDWDSQQLDSDTGVDHWVGQELFGGTIIDARVQHESSY